MTTAGRDAPAWLTPDWASMVPSVRALSTLRRGGCSVGAYASLNLANHVGDDAAAVRTNRQRLASAADLPGEPLWLEQVHGTDIVVHDASHAFGSTPRADASVAFQPGRVCVVMTADCLPVVFTDRAGTRIGVAHAGWRGLAAGVLEATIAALDVDPGELLAWMGPAIGPDAFEVGVEVRTAFIERDPANVAAFAANAAGRYQADIYALARHALLRVGLQRVSGGGVCTSSDPQNYFSYRRDQVTGRMATLAWIDRPR
jgi:YfiH family protein